MPQTQKYAFIINADDPVYLEGVRRMVEQSPEPIESLYFISTQGKATYRYIHLFTQLRVSGFNKVFKSLIQWSKIPKEKSFASLTRAKNIPVYTFKSLNSPEFIEQIQKSGVPALLNMCSQIYKKSTIEKLPPVYNFHPGYLPGNAGRFPIFWAFVNKIPQYLTCHRVSEKIDGGEPLFHYPIPTRPTDSVWEVILTVVDNYPTVVNRVIELIESGQKDTVDLGLQPSVWPRPTSKDIRLFRRVIQENSTRANS